MKTAIVQIAPRSQSARKFIVSDAIEVPVIQEIRGCHIDENAIKDLIRRHAAFTEKRGCYVFGIRAGRGIKPVYVGQAGRQSLGKEAFAPHKRNILNCALMKTLKGTLVVTFVIPEKGPRRISESLLDEIEGVLIQFAYKRNKQIQNKNGIYRSGWYIDGVLNSTPGRRCAASINFGNMLGIKPSVAKRP